MNTRSSCPRPHPVTRRGATATLTGALTLGALVGTGAPAWADEPVDPPVVVVDEAPPASPDEAPPANTAPVGQPHTFTTYKNTQVDLGDLYATLLSDATDADGDPLTIGVILRNGVPSPELPGEALLTQEGSWHYRPPTDFVGTRYFYWTLLDGTNTTWVEGLNFVVLDGDAPPPVDPPASPNTAPVAVNDAFTGLLGSSTSGNVLANDTDADGDPLSVTSWTQPAVGTLAHGTDGSFQFVPPTAGWTGTVTFDYTVSDGEATKTGTVTITYAPDVEAPVAVDDAYSTPADTVLTMAAAQGAFANDSDADSSEFSAIYFPDAQPGPGMLDLDGTTGAFTYTPPSGFQGTATFTYRLKDRGGNFSDFATVTITVGVTDTAPVAVDDAYDVSGVGALTAGADIGILANDSAPGPSPWGVDQVIQPAHGTVTVDLGSGAFTYVADSGWSGTDTWSYRLADSAGATSDWAVVTMTVAAAPGPVDPQNPQNPQNPVDPQNPQEPGTGEQPSGSGAQPVVAPESRPVEAAEAAGAAGATGTTPPVVEPGHPTGVRMIVPGVFLVTPAPTARTLVPAAAADRYPKAPVVVVRAGRVVRPIAWDLPARTAVELFVVDQGVRFPLTSATTGPTGTLSFPALRITRPDVMVGISLPDGSVRWVKIRTT